MLQILYQLKSGQQEFNICDGFYSSPAPFQTLLKAKRAGLRSLQDDSTFSLKELQYEAIYFPEMNQFVSSLFCNFQQEWWSSLNWKLGINLNFWTQSKVLQIDPQFDLL